MVELAFPAADRGRAAGVENAGRNKKKNESAGRGKTGAAAKDTGGKTCTLRKMRNLGA